MPKISKEKKNERRDQILDAAEICFARQGYNRATVDDIVNESGLSKGAIYAYFKSKEEILLNLVERYWSRSAERLQSTLSNCAQYSNQSKLEALISWFMQEANNNVRVWKIVLCEVITNGNNQLKNAMLKRNTSMQELISHVVSEGIELGVHPADIDVPSVAWILFTVSNGIMIHALTQDVDFSQAEQQSQVRRKLREVLTILKLI